MKLLLEKPVKLFFKFSGKEILQSLNKNSGGIFVLIFSSFLLAVPFSSKALAQTIGEWERPYILNPGERLNVPLNEGPFNEVGEEQLVTSQSLGNEANVYWHAPGQTNQVGVDSFVIGGLASPERAIAIGAINYYFKIPEDEHGSRTARVNFFGGAAYKGKLYSYGTGGSNYISIQLRIVAKDEIFRDFDPWDQVPEASSDIFSASKSATIDVAQTTSSFNDTSYTSGEVTLDRGKVYALQAIATCFTHATTTSTLNGGCFFSPGGSLPFNLSALIDGGIQYLGLTLSAAEDLISLVNNNGVKLEALSDSLAALQGQVETVHTDLVTHHENITTSVNTHDSTIKSQLATHHENITTSVNTHDSTIKSQLATHDADVKSNLSGHDAAIKTILGTIKAQAEQHDLDINQLENEIIRLLKTPFGQIVEPH